jgi:hypothetical protein
VPAAVAMGTLQVRLLQVEGNDGITGSLQAKAALADTFKSARAPSSLSQGSIGLIRVRCHLCFLSRIRAPPAAFYTSHMLPSLEEVETGRGLWTLGRCR